MSLVSSRKPVSNPPNPWEKEHVDWLGPPPETGIMLHEDASRSIIAANTSPDVPFSHSVNPYRGCTHGCAYCYARPTHERLGFGAGTDFDRQIVVKRDAPNLLREAFEKKRWRGDLVVFSGVTDCYQPVEASLGLTRACLEVCRDYRNPVAIITKSALIARDIDLLSALHAEAYCQVLVSVPFFNPAHAGAIEPLVPSPARRFKTIRELSEAGIPTGVNVAPVIPGLSDEDIPNILRVAREAGATFASMILVRLPGSVGPVFEARVRAAFPLRAEKIFHQIAACRGGKPNETRFGARMRGVGGHWQVIQSLFEKTRAALGYTTPPPVPDPSPFRRPRGAGRPPGAQMRLDL